ncbi:MAG TPA: glycoside hydrolase family 88 protein [Opitutaceae bacterium]|jgi:unsaturated rhamnogalacturonyl hydrolase
MAPHPRRFLAFAALLLSWGRPAALAAPASDYDGRTGLGWAEAMASSQMARVGSSLDYRGSPKPDWNYTSGFFAHALEVLGTQSGNSTYSRFGSRLVDSFVGPDGEIHTYRPKDFNLDEILPGRALLDQLRIAPHPALRRAADRLRAQLAQQPRTPGGGFWHKRVYPDQMWLDGLYMSGPFYAEYGSRFHDPAAVADARRQLVLVDQHLYSPQTGLYFHAWDASRSLAWANRATGHSPSFWGRSIGWYAMAIADEIDFEEPRSSAGPLTDLFQRVAAGIVRWQDPDTGVWWQVVDQGGRPGNYREESASCMFVYALATGVSEGRLPRHPYADAAERGFQGIVRQFVRSGTSGELNLEGCCAVAGLNNRSASGHPRDGTYSYYVSEKPAENDLKGVAAFILSGLAVQSLTAPSPSTP